MGRMQEGVASSAEGSWDSCGRGSDAGGVGPAGCFRTGRLRMSCLEGARRKSLGNCRNAAGPFLGAAEGGGPRRT